VAPPLSTTTAKPARRALPDHLPRETRTHTPKETVCPQCQGELRKLGEDVAEVLEYVPASFRVIRHVRTKLSCTQCDCIVQAEAPSRPIERGLAGPGLLAHVLVSKYADHLPLYRQSEIYARQGVELERSTMADWVGGASQLLDPLVEALHHYVIAAGKLHADDTPVPVLAPGQGKTKTGRLWTYVRDDRPAGDNAAPAVWFAYSPDRKGEHPAEHLKRFRGILQADAYAGFNQLYEDGRIEQAACWAHYPESGIIPSEL
jgi:transposase